MKHLRQKRWLDYVEPTDMTSISNSSQILQHGLTNPEYLMVLNKSYSTKRKTPREYRLKGDVETRITFAEKLTISGSLLSMF